MGAAYLIFFTNTSLLGNQSGVYQTTNTLRSLILYQIPITSFICASDLIFSPLGTLVVLKVCCDTLHTYFCMGPFRVFTLIRITNILSEVAT